MVRTRLNRVVLHLGSALRRSSVSRPVPVFHHARPISHTGDMSTWYTARKTVPARKSHLNVAVCDSDWEATAARKLDAHPEVAAWAKNDHLGFEIFYSAGGVVRTYRPDFLVRFASGATLVLEIKGQYTENAKAKNDALREWVAAVDADGRFGAWSSAVCLDPGDLRRILDEHAGRRAA